MEKSINQVTIILVCTTLVVAAARMTTFVRVCTVAFGFSLRHLLQQRTVLERIYRAAHVAFAWRVQQP